MKLWKYSGTFLTITGVIHTIVALIMGKDVYWDMLKSGLVNSTGDDFTRGFSLWFLVCGVLLVFMGTTLQFYIKKTQSPAPVFLGYSILVFSIIGCIIEPFSGFWLFIPQALIILLAGRKTS